MPGFELIGKEERQAVNEIFDKGGVLYRYGMNDRRQNIFRVDLFEQAIAKKVGVKYALVVCNGTSAVKLALIASGIKKGDEVIMPSFTFVATIEAILEIGAIPIIAEIDKSLNIDPKDFEKKITKKTKAVLPVHMAGVSAKMDEIMAIARKYKLVVIEDSCQALGATYKGKYLGTIGDVGCYSFDIGKVITCGEGGALVTNNKAIYLKAREYADHGHEQNPKVPRGEDTRNIWGFNYKATEFTGAVGLAQLKKMDYILQKQKENKKKLKDKLSSIPGIEFRKLFDPKGDAGDTLIFFLDQRKRASALTKILAKKGIGTKNLPDAVDWHYAGTWTQVFKDFPKYKGKNLEKVWQQSTNYLRRAIALPIMVNMTNNRIDEIAEVIRLSLKEI